MGSPKAESKALGMAKGTPKKVTRGLPLAATIP